MAVDFFLVDAPHTVPTEYNEWQAAYRRWHSLFKRVMESDQWHCNVDALEEQACTAKAEADWLEQIARQAWLNTVNRKPK